MGLFLGTLLGLVQLLYFLLGGSGVGSNWGTWFAVSILLFMAGASHMARFATIHAEFVLEAAFLFFHGKLSKGFRTLGNSGIDLWLIHNKVSVLGRRRRVWSLWVLALVDFIGAIKFVGFGYKVGEGGRCRGNTK